MGFNIEEAESVCDNFTLSANVGLTILSPEGAELYKSGENACGFCKALEHLTGAGRRCAMAKLYGSLQARRFGGRYVFFCPMGLVNFASPIMQEGEQAASITGGPLMMLNPNEYLNEDILEKYNPSPEDAQKARELISEIPASSPARVHALSELLYIAACHLSDNTGRQLNSNYNTQNIISDYIYKLTSPATSFYPIDKEEKLLDALADGNKRVANALLNEILGFILFYSGFDYNTIRSRILELLVLISRAAVKGGADPETVFKLTDKYIGDIDGYNDIEALTGWLNTVMNRFTEYVFSFVGAKHADIIFKAVDYIKNNYMNRITLNDAARYVLLSPAYFSKVFKDETGMNFSAYLNDVRIRQAKKILTNDTVRLSLVANLVGYDDQSYFTKVFKKNTGVTPIQYRQSRGKKI